jgi:phospholipid/cholesterol/gamma-HCH transport system ATP-binding protein
MDEITMAKLTMVGLKPEVAERFPSELSGGMIKRVALARALIMDPPLLLLDEPTAGLDPDRSDAFCDLVRSLHRELGLTVVMVTHDLDTIYEISTEVAVVADRHVIVHAPPKEVIAFDHPFVREFFLGGRGLRAQELLRLHPNAE